MNAEENTPKEYNGKQYTTYEALQRQRRLETTLRAQRQEIKLLEQGHASQDDIIAAKSRYFKTSHEYAEFSKAMGLPQQRERITVDGLGKIKSTPKTSESITGKSSKKLEKSGESGIINSRSEDMSQEYQRYGRNKDTLVNKTYLESGEYRRKFDNATDSPEVNKTLYDCSKDALKHRSGTLYEDMYWIDSNNGKVLFSVTDSKEQRAIIYTNKIKQNVKSHSNVVTLHTHPSSMPPSVSDLNSCFRNNYKIGFIACHNGRVFGYTSNIEINERLYDLYVGEFISKGNSEFDSQMNALKKLSENFDIKVWEVVP